MPYTPNSWVDGPTGLTPMTAAALTHAETQYAQATAYTDAKLLGSSILNVVDYGAVGDGVTDASSAIQAAVDSAADGKTIYFPAGTYLLNGSPITNVQSGGAVLSLHFVMADSAKLVKAGNSEIFKLVGAWDATQAVSAITSSTVADEGLETLNTVVLTVTGTMAWKRGDIVKVFSSDIIPGSRSDDGTFPTLSSRTGQFFTVYSTASNTVTLLGVLRDPMTANMRVARLQDINATIDGGVLDIADSFLTNGYTAQFVTLYCLKNPAVRHVTIKRTGAQAVNVGSCVNALVENVQVGWARNDATTVFGYGVNDNASSFTKVVGCHFAQIRHGYTDSNTTNTTTDPDPGKYGRTYGARIESCTVDSPTSAAFDTHSGGDSASFVNCIAINAVIGFSLRGRRHSIVDAQVRNCVKAFRFFTESTAGDSWGHSLDGAQVDGTAGAVVEVALNWGATHPQFGVQETRTISLKNIMARNVVGDAFIFTNAKIDMANINIEYGGAVGTEGNLVTNTRVMGTNVRFDYFNTTGSGQVLFNMATDPYMEFRGLRLVGFSSLASRVSKVFAPTSASVLRITDLDVDYQPSTSIYDQVTTASWVDYKIGAAPGSSSRMLQFVQADITVAANLRPIQRTRAEHITAEVNCTTAATLAALPVALVQGQLLAIVNTGTATLTIPNGTTSIMASGANTGIPALSSMLLESNGSGNWRQVKTV